MYTLMQKCVTYKTHFIKYFLEKIEKSKRQRMFCVLQNTKHDCKKVKSGLKGVNSIIFLLSFFSSQKNRFHLQKRTFRDLKNTQNWTQYTDK